MSPDDALDVLEWRQRVHEMYAEVREGLEPAQSWEWWRQERDELFAEHAASPIPEERLDAFTGLEFPDYDEAWRFEPRIEPAEPARLEVPTGTDGVVPFERIGLVRLPFGTLDVWWLASYGGGLFVPVKDASAGRPGGTYGGGRYLIDTVKGADLGGSGSRIVLDFNFAYNPSCAYDEAWACPLAPPGNTVAIDIPVGERTFAH